VDFFSKQDKNEILNFSIISLKTTKPATYAGLLLRPKLSSKIKNKENSLLSLLNTLTSDVRRSEQLLYFTDYS